MDTDRLGKLVRQHAETARLMGVDFVPCFRVTGDDQTPTAGPPAHSTSAPPSAPTQTTPRAQGDAPATAPAMARAAVRASARATAPASAPAASAEVETKPAPRPGKVTTPATREAKAAALDELRRRYESDAPHRHFTTNFHNIVFGDGDPAAELLFIGEAPGEEEDLAGKPFVGRSGQLLNQMIAGMGLDRSRVYICNVLKTRPPNNATPTPREVELCAPYLHEQVTIIGPKVIVTLGLPASRVILATDATMGSMRGRWAEYALLTGVKVPVMPTYHPAYVLRNYTQETRGKVWSDLKLVMGRLGLTPPAKGGADSSDSPSAARP